MSDRRCLSGAWILEPSDIVCIRRPSDGTVLELEDVDHVAFSALWDALGRPRTDEELRRDFRRIADGEELLDLFLAHNVLRSSLDAPAPPIDGGGVLPSLARDLTSLAGWDLPPLLFVDGADLEGGPRPRPACEIAIAAYSDVVVAMGMGCEACMLLRTLGSAGSPGAVQTGSACRSTLGPGDLRALLAALFLEISAARPSSFEGIWIRSEKGVERGSVRRHGDCPKCSRREGRVYDAAWLREDMRTHTSATANLQRIRDVFGGSPFAPLRIDDPEEPYGQFPFDGRYIAGDTRLSRMMAGRTFCVSMPSMVHGSAATSEHSRLLAWSEGVERLSAASARVEMTLSAGDERVAASRDRYGWHRRRGVLDPAFCTGVDLLRDEICLVPFERVAVGLPPSLAPDEIPVETTFTGVASHATSIEAILHGTVEVLKRDAFLVAWYRKRCLRLVELPTSLPADIAERLSYLSSHGIELRALDLRADLPLPMLLIEARAQQKVGQWPAGGAILVPAGGLTPLSALRSALTLISSRFVGIGLSESKLHDPLDPVAVFELSRTLPFWPGIARYLDPARATDLEFLFGNESIGLESMSLRGGDSPRERFDAFRMWLREARLNWIAVPLIDDDTVLAGLRATKVIVPEAVQMHLQARDIDSKHARFQSDFPGAARGSWNDAPHPLY